MKHLRMIPLVFAFVAICVGDALGASPSNETAPSVQSISPVQSDFRVAQAGPPPSGNELTTKDDIRWLWDYNERRWKENERRWEQNERRWEQSQRQWSELRNDLSTFKNTVVAILGGILGVMMAMLFQNYSRGRNQEKSANAKMSGAM